MKFRCLCRIALLLAPMGAVAQTRPVDLLLRGGQVVDGSGSAPITADVGTGGDRSVFVGESAKLRIRAARTIDVKGLVVSPGFIDPHAHVLEDLADAARKTNECYLMHHHGDYRQRWRRAHSKPGDAGQMEPAR